MAKFILWDKENNEAFENGKPLTREEALAELCTMHAFDWDEDAIGKPFSEATLEDFDGWELRPVTSKKLAVEIAEEEIVAVRNVVHYILDDQDYDQPIRNDAHILLSVLEEWEGVGIRQAA